VKKSRALFLVMLAACATVGMTRRAYAQSTSSPTGARALPERLSPTTRALLDKLFDSSRAVGLPTAPLFDKAAEGVLKGADDERIVRAVQTLVRELGEARGALGVPSDISVLGAAASALHAGVSVNDLRSLAHPTIGAPGPAALSSALVTLVDLVAKRVPVATATRSIRDLLERKASEREFVELRSDVEQDILAGRSPEASLTARVHAVTRP
jgi:hypothetical protein